MTGETEPAATGYAADGFAPVANGRLEIRPVWAHNVDYEFSLIRKAVEKFPYVSMDTEFPGVIHHPTKRHSELTPSERYASIKANVDALHLIQVGLAFAESPEAPAACAFEINFREFDPSVHRYAPESITLLANNGIDFTANRNHGVDARYFTVLLKSSGLVCSDPATSAVTWVTFQASYDFGYMVKILMGRRLPRTLPEFLAQVRVFFGDKVYDVKHIMQSRPVLYGGLDVLASLLGVERAAGMSHQAGSDSVFTWDVFRRMREVHFAKEDVSGFAGVIHDLVPPQLDLAAAGD